MSFTKNERSARFVTKAIGYSCFLGGMAYAGYLNGLLKGRIGDLHRGALVIGFIIGVGFLSSYVMRSLANRLTDRSRKQA